MKDVSDVKLCGVTDKSLFLSVDVRIPRLLSPDFKYPVDNVLERQFPHKFLKDDDDFHIYGSRHWNQQVFRFLPDLGLVLSERFDNVALNVGNDYLQLVDRKYVPATWKWRIVQSKFPSIDELRHSHFELDNLLIEYLNTDSDLTNDTHVTVDDIQPAFVNSITGTVYDTEESEQKEQKQNITENQIIIEQKETEQSKKKNITMWIFIIVTVIVVITAIYSKIGCFSNYAIMRLSTRRSIEETSGENHNN
jgi:hypothetical protein